MSEHDPIRDAMLARSANPSTSAAEVLGGLRPRLRKARLIRTLAATGVSLSLIAGIGVGVVLVNTDPAPTGLVTADDGADQGEPDQTATTPVETAIPVETATVVVTPTVVATPTVELEFAPIPTSTGEDNVDPEVEATSTPTADQPTPEPDEADPAAPSATPDPTPAATPTEEPDPVATPVKPSPTVVPNMSQLIETSGGDIIVEYTASEILSVAVDAAPGFADEVEKMEATEVKVIFTSEDDAVEVEIRVEEGVLSWDVSPDEAEE